MMGRSSHLNQRRNRRADTGNAQASIYRQGHVPLGRLEDAIATCMPCGIDGCGITRHSPHGQLTALSFIRWGQQDQTASIDCPLESPKGKGNWRGSHCRNARCRQAGGSYVLLGQRESARNAYTQESGHQAQRLLPSELSGVARKAPPAYGKTKTEWRSHGRS
jgi:hypothetical protein